MNTSGVDFVPSGSRGLPASRMGITVSLSVKSTQFSSDLPSNNLGAK